MSQDISNIEPARRGDAVDDAELLADQPATKKDVKFVLMDRGLLVRRVAELVVVAVVVAGAAFVSGRLPSRTVMPAVQPATAGVNMACPWVGSNSGVLAGATGSPATLTPDRGAPQTLNGPVFSAPLAASSTLVGHGSLTATAEFERPGQMAGATCATPASDGYLLLDSPDAVVTLTNVDIQDAVLNLSVYGPNGPVDSGTLIDLKVFSGTTIQLPMSQYAPGTAPIAVRWQNTIGRVVAWAQVDTAAGLDLVTPTREDTQIVVPGVPSGLKTILVLTNPATVRTKARVDTMTPDGRLTVAGAEEVTIEAGSTATIDVSAAAQGGDVGLFVVAEKALAASVWVTAGSDLASSSGVPYTQLVSQDRLVMAPAPGRLVLSNASQAGIRTVVTITGDEAPDMQIVTVGPGASLSVPVGVAGLVRVQAGTGLIASLVTQPDAANGINIMRLPPDTAWAGVTPVWAEAQPH